MDKAKKQAQKPTLAAFEAPPANWEPALRVFAALGDEHRQRIMLSFEKGKETAMGALVEAFAKAKSPLSRPAVSHHVKALVEAGCLTRAKRGKEVFLSINKKALIKAVENALDLIKERS